jgi:hypothetical protein
MRAARRCPGQCIRQRFDAQRWRTIGAVAVVLRRTVAGLRAARGPQPDTRLRGNTRGGHGRIREELAARVKPGTGRLFLDATGAIALIVFN